MSLNPRYIVLQLFSWLNCRPAVSTEFKVGPDNNSRSLNSGDRDELTDLYSIIIRTSTKTSTRIYPRTSCCRHFWRCKDRPTFHGDHVTPRDVAGEVHAVQPMLKTPVYGRLLNGCSFRKQHVVQFIAWYNFNSSKCKFIGCNVCKWLPQGVQEKPLCVSRS